MLADVGGNLGQTEGGVQRVRLSGGNMIVGDPAVHHRENLLGSIHDEVTAHIVAAVLRGGVARLDVVPLSGGILSQARQTVARNDGIRVSQQGVRI